MLMMQGCFGSTRHWLACKIAGNFGGNNFKTCPKTVSCSYLSPHLIFAFGSSSRPAVGFVICETELNICSKCPDFEGRIDSWPKSDSCGPSWRDIVFKPA